ncbi:conserved hypothetical protein [Neospora caninum Liverpool]|uniref:Uncharacterized protein n=6 Tax=Sarcocystidae TaxID=5809 RepID=F0VF85_NEOCL|nr:conserved hypothetical protein [Neospora caninum Liverpool]CBZ52379.1 conserved hypothetical protein [Neospora caninum Liverpool]|eukprot:XP_003882411.1 conserved hypothetical protein [Neospora caninum Liverpool]
MVKCRGFKPQGMVLNPIRRVVSSGPSLMEKLQRDSRPTWEELRKMLKKKEESANEFLERYENEQFSGQLEFPPVGDPGSPLRFPVDGKASVRFGLFGWLEKSFRNSKIEEQERQHLELLRQEAKQRRKRAREEAGPSDSSAEESSTGERSDGSDSDRGSSGKKKKSEKKKKKKDKKKKHKREKKRKSEKSESRHKDSGRNDPACAASNNPYRLSNFFSDVRAAEGPASSSKA